MKKIPSHKIAQQLDGELVKLKYLSAGSYLPAAKYAHRDDYYIFFFIEKGSAKLLIDFKTYEVKVNTVYFTLPEQVHSVVDFSENTSAWALFVDSSLVKEEYQEIFNRSAIFNGIIEADEATIADLQAYLSILERRFHSENQAIAQNILHDLLSSYIGMIAEVHQIDFSTQVNKRMAAITFQFKSLLAANYQSLKSPSQYADKLNISPIYLNQAVKAVTGLTVSECIRNEIVLRAKRLLVHTNRTVKEIAFELGYEDCAYFTRLFSKASLLSPTQFRAKYFK
ncbi:MAG: AraC family transcriptional regulator [Mangrovibacterium sp.]